MDHFDLYHTLLERVSFDHELVALPDGIEARTREFRSRHGGWLPGADAYHCAQHDLRFQPLPADSTGNAAAAHDLDVDDATVADNVSFQYTVLRPSQLERSGRVILLLHGLNERDWSKYLPWAHLLACRTGGAVVLFPIAFHMNRAPRRWSDRRSMHRAAQARQRAHPAIIASSLSNVAISSRLHARPQRFFWSGLQTYHDIVQLADQIADDLHPDIAPQAPIDLFAYSIGGLIAEVLLMASPRPVFDASRLCLFCAGAVFNRMSPVSRFILDSEANVALYSYVVEHLESHLRANARLAHHLGPQHAEGPPFCAMLAYGLRREEREAQFRRLRRRLLALALASDTVVPPYEVMSTVQGAARDIPVPVEVRDFPYPHRHEDPFPVAAAYRSTVDRAFQETFERAAVFLSE